MLVVVLVLLGAGLLSFLATALAASAVALLATLALMRREAALTPAFEPRVWRELLRDVLPYAAALRSGPVYLEVTMVAMSLLDSAREVGHFAAALRVFQVLVGIAWVLAVSAFPVVARAGQQGDA